MRAVDNFYVTDVHHTNGLSKYSDLSESVKREILTMPDPTRDAVIRQIHAMHLDTFELGVFDSVNERMIPRTWNEETLLKSIAWLRFENLQGCNIYIRPAGIHSLSLVDDLTADAVEKMKREGFSPAAVTETSPNNFQAWVQHGRILDKTLSTATAKALARRFGGDQGSADWRHFGRLAGYTNRKQKHRQPEGYFPYVRLIEAEGLQYPEAANFLRHVEEEVREATRAWMERREFLRKAPHDANETIKNIDYFRSHSKYGGAQSRSDLAYAVYALDHGVSETRVRDAIASQDLSFKGTSSRQADYIERIIEKASAFLRGSAVER